MKLVLFAGALTAFALLGSAQAQQPVVLKFSHVVTDDTPKGKGAIRFKELAEAKTKRMVECLSGLGIGRASCRERV